MDKQQIAHTLEKDINVLNDVLTRLQIVGNHEVNPHLLRELNIIYDEVSQVRKSSKKIIENIVNDAKLDASYTK